MNYSAIKPVDIANGPGVRVSLFVSGCPHRCKGCFNEETWDYEAGELFTGGTWHEILRLCARPFIAGLSLLGGEPLDPNNLHDVAILAASFKKKFPNKTLWCYTGYRWEEVSQLYFMKYIDVLVDGPFIEELKDLQLKFRGSANQRIIDVQESLKQGHVVLWEGER